MVCMQIAESKEDPGHNHPFDQCGIVVEGEIEMFVGEERKRLGAKRVLLHPGRRAARLENVCKAGQAPGCINKIASNRK